MRTEPKGGRPGTALLVLSITITLILLMPMNGTGTSGTPRARSTAADVRAFAVDPKTTTSRGNLWQNVSPMVAPSSRVSPAVAYDSLRNRLLLFGGSRFNDSWSYDPALNRWTNLSTPGPPVSWFGSTHILAYDARADRFILWGAGANWPNETWSYDPGTNRWTNLRPAATPMPFHNSAMVYDARADRIILFGGGDLAPQHWSSSNGDTWSYDYGNNTWTKLAPTGAPRPRYGHAMAYNPASGRILLFGGFSGFDIFSYALNDTWTYDSSLNTWTNRTPASSPSPRGLGCGAYDSVSDVFVLFGGSSSSVLFNETWALDARGVWIDQNPAVAPSARQTCSLAFDPATNRTILFGGQGANYPGTNETWTYEYATIVPSSPSAPRDLLASATQTQIGLSWQPPGSDGGYLATNYRVYRGLSQGTETLLADAGDARVWVDHDVSIGTRYWYEVTARNAVGESPRSNEVSAVPPDQTYPTVVISTPAEGAVLTGSTVTIRGTAWDNVAVERVEVSTDLTHWTPATGTTSWSVDLRLPEGTNRIWAGATDTWGNGGILASINVTVQPNATQSGGATGIHVGPWTVDPPLIGGAVLATVASVAASVVLLRRLRRSRGAKPPP